jgi:seryl-tRNA synthetase
MIDLNLLRKDKGANLDVIYNSEKRRYRDTAILDKCIELDKQWREVRANGDTLRMNYSKNNKQIADRKKASKGQDPCKELIEENQGLDIKIQESEKQETELIATLNKLLKTVGNLVHDSVPTHNDEQFNDVVKKWGEPKTIEMIDKPGGAHHNQLLYWIGGYDSKRGTKIAGQRGYFLTGPGVLLNHALLQYGLRFLMSRGYTPIQPPYFMKQDIMGDTCQLSDFDEQLYKIEGNPDPFYLIATSEQPIATMYKNEWFDSKDLPIKYAGISPCFRKEAGAHGRDTWGVYRVHQFEKIEQFCIVNPEESWDVLESMLKSSEEYYQSLGIPYRVVTIVSGALNDAAAKKYDLEAWFPGYGEYRELVSCSNCTDYQARGAEIRIRTDKTKSEEKKYVHMLNGTLCASERAMCCLLENYQTPEGIKVPEVLIPYVGTDFIPFIKEKIIEYDTLFGDKKKKDKK